MGRAFEVPEPRNDHVNVVEFRSRRSRINQRHRSLQPPVMFDQDDADMNSADRCVLLTQAEAVRIAELLRCARGHLPSPKACDEAIGLLTKKKGA